MTISQLGRCHAGKNEFASNRIGNRLSMNLVEVFPTRTGVHSSNYGVGIHVRSGKHIGVEKPGGNGLDELVAIIGIGRETQRAFGFDVVSRGKDETRGFA